MTFFLEVLHAFFCLLFYSLAGFGLLAFAVTLLSIVMYERGAARRRGR